MRQLVRDTREFIDRAKTQDRPGYELAGMSELRKVITDLAKLTGEMDSSTTVNIQINLTQVVGEVRSQIMAEGRHTGAGWRCESP
jgi:hypothetical protein